ncbi:hypothetical protein RN96_11630 [Fusobacterium polymorphum]|uniref:Uncharacterized protein n=1 Tax=Fusobacterium nucleatum subsp. polymorphum TaxID=76857 RepID=A0A2B7YFB1_FUSNP|nr:hypothetical protein [Fusobacterium polymorphum]PGH20216.1 hypothetical protein RN96_11630 [Fusobacterium polymorphum]
MKKIILNTIEDRKYQVFKKLVESNGNKLKAALKLQVTPQYLKKNKKKAIYLPLIEVRDFLLDIVEL